MMRRLLLLVIIILGSALLLLASCASAISRSVLWRGDSISVEEDGRLVSPSGNFSCGFHKVATNAYTFAIWFTRTADATVAWTANRDDPLNGRGSLAKFRRDGSLVLLDLDGRVAWSTNTSGGDRVQLLDSGNLVVMSDDATGRTLWQSFDWPTDTLLPGQPITRYKRLVSASARGLPSSGFYNLYFDSNNILNLMYDGPEMSSNYWPPPYNRWWENNRTAYNSSRFGSLDTSGVFTASDHTLINASDTGVFTMRRLTLDYDGNLRLYSLDDDSDSDSRSWRVSWVAVPRQCDVHGVCGRYGVCAYRPGPTCSCPDGYVAADPADWSKGCRRLFEVRCGDEVDFLEMPFVDFYGFDFNYTTGLTLETCRQICVDDCNCEAFGYKKGSGECFPKIAMWSGKVSDFRQTIYLKVPMSLLKQPAVLLDHVCRVTERDANVSADYLRVKRGKVEFAYFYWFLAVLFVLEAVFMAAGYLFVFFRAPGPANKLRNEEGYATLFSHFRRFAYAELSDATCRFREQLGKGVYKGVLDDGRAVAVKRLEEMTQVEEVFRAELSVIGRINHMNLVRMWGFCSEDSHRLLVSEYVDNGSLAKALFDDHHILVLGWQSRYKIAVGVAKALAYLHHECLEWILHCDVKPENILLDAELQPKITDFGLVKLLSRDACRRSRSSSVLSRVRGTRGYIAPEWALMNVPITGKADVYSFGVVLLELLRGKRVCDWVEDHARIDFNLLVASLKDKLTILRCEEPASSSWLEELVDPRLRGDFSRLQAAGMLELAVSCVDDDPNRRPSMNTVLQKLLASDNDDAGSMRYL
ncbi:hypothetical protein PR202_ga18758 [Eleusine coracana subsp. coracana]|uniref:Receptor-like serine/threonine-protein kinase n=1 Tax=Eleusine coracana subsp. coracana TaxID=191504 RepID=A0AAV5CTQ0_ELECO|nr:hypothetical protein QOZ80_4AG0301130 [Eleusine coracana subsp. coracana]GJN01488.1 hypothetical protein PR202_ga18758 [Eleusine coracana subsp. coracana]